MNRTRRHTLVAFTAALLLAPLVAIHAADKAPPSLRAGVAKVDITNPVAAARDAPLYARALLLSDGDTTAVLVTVDAVAIAEIGSIGNDYLGRVRSQLEKELKIKPACVLINASHCHGLVCKDVEHRTV